MNINYILQICGIIVVLILIGELFHNKEWQRKLTNIWAWYNTGNKLDFKHQLFTIFVLLSVFNILRFILGDGLFRALKYIVRFL